MNARIKLVALILLALPAYVKAQSDEQQALNRAYAAGYKAQFLCSGLWNGGKTVEQIERDELTGIYPEIADIVPTLKAEIDQERKMVTVAFSENTPPRIAKFQSHDDGCVSLPIGWQLKTEEGFNNLPTPNVQSAYPPGHLDNAYWPMGDKTNPFTAEPTFQKIAKVADSGFDNPEFGNGKTSAILITKGGNIYYEKYALGHDMHTSQRTWSVAKSIAATYVGYMKHASGDALNLYSSHILRDPRNSVSIDHMLRMSSGFVSDSPGNRTDAIYMGGGAVEEYATIWPVVHKPGTVFRYANNDTLLAVLKSENISRQKKPFLSLSELFRKIGMTRTVAERDWRYRYILSSQVWTTPRDLARLGQLYLNDGRWPYGERPERLLPENWRDYVSKPSGPQPDGKFGYGAQFWLMNKSDGIPADTFAAFGNRGQYLVIIPSLNMVIVRRGYDSEGSHFDIEAFTRDIVAAVQ
ncbi:serine hydrolase domain-containing protein [Sphingorhabdus arenilitoris]|uniref:Serine hydrolase domain-containing protein n=1 Tax=Sphingorhabdus arenilitoris TaxID=1490041 RepID=A0ABV8RIB2_9SPHN